MYSSDASRQRIFQWCQKTVDIFKWSQKKVDIFQFHQDNEYISNGTRRERIYSSFTNM
jgi:hypothetical protein